MPEIQSNSDEVFTRLMAALQNLRTHSQDGETHSRNSVPVDPSASEDYQRAMAILYERLEQVKEKCNEELFQLKKALDGEREAQLQDGDPELPARLSFLRIDELIKQWYRLPSSEFDPRVIREVVAEVTKLRSVWKGSWKHSNFSHKMIFLAAQTIPLFEHLREDPRVLIAMFDKATKNKDDTEGDIDRDIYSAYWSGVFKDVDIGAAESSDDV